MCPKMKRAYFWIFSLNFQVGTRTCTGPRQIENVTRRRSIGLCSVRAQQSQASYCQQALSPLLVGDSAVAAVAQLRSPAAILAVFSAFHRRLHPALHRSIRDVARHRHATSRLLGLLSQQAPAGTSTSTTSYRTSRQGCACQQRKTRHDLVQMGRSRRPRA